MTLVREARLAILAPFLAACVLKGDPISPYGRTATVHQSGAGKVSGELIAATSDSIWLLRDSALVALSGAAVSKISVQRHRFNGKKTLWWMAIAGGGTGVALLVACQSYNSSGDGGTSECSSVLPGTLLFFMAVGGLFALGNEYSSKFHLSAGDTDRLRAYSRFPQGLPDSVPRLLPRPR